MDPSALAELKRLGVELPTDSAFPVDSEPERKPPVAAYTAKNDRFVLNESGYERQYAQTYFCRYHQMKPHLETSAKKRWPQTQLCRVLDMREIQSEQIATCGILFKDMKLKPQLLDEYLSKRVVEKELQLNKNRVRDDDVIFLEDDGTRIQLTGDAFSANAFVSGSPIRAILGQDRTAGMCVAVKGCQLTNGTFEVHDICAPECAPQLVLPAKRRCPEGYLLLASGLNLATIAPKNRLALELLAQLISGSLANPQDISHRIAHVVVCGGLVGKNEDLATGSPNSRQQIRALRPIMEVDGFVDHVAQCVSVDVMPGLDDPATFLMPQQPLHKCLFPHAARHPQFRRVTNPHLFEIDGIQVLGTSGQNVTDILLHSSLDCGVDALEQCLQYRHMAPTCPDTLTCFPFNQLDPFVLEETPHIFFAGNQPAFETRLSKRDGAVTSLVCVPDFSQTGEVVLVHLSTLKAQKLCLDASLTFSK